MGASSKTKGKQALNKSHQYAACGRRTPFPWLLRRHSKGAAVLSVMLKGDMEVMYLSANEIEQLEGVEKQHFLNPEALRINKSLGDAVGLRNLGVHQVLVPAGHYSTEYHVHYYEEECIYILSGTGVATLGDQQQRIGPGDFIGCPINGQAHDMFNDGTEPLVCLVIGQRLEQDVTDYPKLGKRLSRNSGEWTVVEHAAITTVRRKKA